MRRRVHPDPDGAIDLGAELALEGAKPRKVASIHEPEDLGFLGRTPVGDIENAFSNHDEHHADIDEMLHVDLDNEGMYVNESARLRSARRSRGFVQCKDGATDDEAYFLSAVKGGQNRAKQAGNAPGQIIETAEDAFVASVQNGSTVMVNPMADPVIEERVTKMFKSLKEAKSIVAAGNKDLRKAKHEVEKLREKVNVLEREKEEAEAKAEREIMLFKYKNIKAFGGSDRLAEAEAKRKRDEARRQLFSDGAIDDFDDDADFADDHLTGSNVSTFINRLKRQMKKRLPFKEDLRRIEARFGSSVACYFYFSRWVVMTYFGLMLLCFIFLLKHILYLAGLAASTPGGLEGQSARNVWNGTTHWTAVSVFIPKFLTIGSYQPGKEASTYVDPSSGISEGVCTSDATPADLKLLNGSDPALWDYNPNDGLLGERLDYVFLLGLMNLIIIIVAAYKWIQEDKKARAFEVHEQAGGKMKYAKISLNAWDHSLRKEAEVEDWKFNLRESFRLVSHEDDVVGIKELRTVEERTKLLVRRISGTFLFLLILSGSAASIVYLQIQSAELKTALSQSALLSNAGSTADIIASSIVPLAVAAINGVLPLLVRLLSAYEMWDSEGFRLKFMLLRLYAAKISNALIQVFSFLQLSDPFLLRGMVYFGIELDQSSQFRQSTEKRFGASGQKYAQSGTFPSGIDECRLDRFGADMFQLVIIQWIVDKLSVPMFVYLFKFIAKMQKKAFVKWQFDVARTMVNLLFFQQLCFLSLPFFPFGTIIIFFMILLDFKYDKLMVEKFYQKPKKPWGAQDAGSFFVKFYWITYSIGLLVTIYTINNVTFSKACNLMDQQVDVLYTDNPDPLAATLTVNPDDPGSSSVPCATVLSNRFAAYAGLEELRFWQGYYCERDNITSITNAQLESFLRADMGIANGVQVKFSTLLVCSLSCGPFVYNSNAYEPAARWMNYRIPTLYDWVSKRTLFVWALLSILLFAYQFKKNRLSVIRELHLEKEVNLRTVIGSLERKVQKLEKTLQVHKKR